MLSQAKQRKSDDIITNIQYIQKCLTACEEALWHNDFHSIILTLRSVGSITLLYQGIHVHTILHKFQGCITFLLKSSGGVCFTLYAHHPYIPTVPQTWSGVFKHIVYWNDHRVNTLDLFWNRKWRGVTGRNVHHQMASLHSKTQPRFLIKALWCYTYK